MKTYEIRSDVKTSWAKIDESALISREKVKSGPFRSAVHRHPGECRTLSPATVARKIASAARIASIKNSPASQYLALA